MSVSNPSNNVIELHYNLTAEQSVLGYMIQEPKFIHALTTTISSDYFYLHTHKTIFSALSKMHKKDNAIDLILLEDFLRKNGTPECDVPFSYLVELVKNLPSASNCLSYAQIVKNHYADRKAEEALDKFKEERDLEKLQFALEKVQKLRIKEDSLFDFEQIKADQHDLIYGEVTDKDILFDNCLPAEEVGILAATGGTGKSYLSLHLAVSVALQVPALTGWKSAFKPSSMGKVVIIAGEDHHDDFKRRIRCVCDTMGLTSDDDKKALSENLFVRSVAGLDARIIKEEHGSVVITDVIDQLIVLLKQIQQVRLVIIDPMSAFYNAPENCNSTATLFMNTVLKICRAMTGCAVLLIHHSAKGEAGSIRGAGGFVDRARTALSLTTIEQENKRDKKKSDINDSNNLILRMIKSNHVKHWDSNIYLERQDNGSFKTIRPTEELETAAAKIKEDDCIMELIAFIEKHGATSGNWIVQNKDSVFTEKHGDNYLKKILKRLKDDNTVYEEGKKLHITKAQQ